MFLLASPVAAQGVPRLDSYNGGDLHHIIDPTINQRERDLVDLVELMARHVTDATLLTAFDQR